MIQAIPITLYQQDHLLSAQRPWGSKVRGFIIDTFGSWRDKILTAAAIYEFVQAIFLVLGGYFMAAAISAALSALFIRMIKVLKEFASHERVIARHQLENERHNLQNLQHKKNNAVYEQHNVEHGKLNLEHRENNATQAAHNVVYGQHNTEHGGLNKDQRANNETHTVNNQWQEATAVKLDAASKIYETLNKENAAVVTNFMKLHEEIKGAFESGKELNQSIIAQIGEQFNGYSAAFDTLVADAKLNLDQHTAAAFKGAVASFKELSQSSLQLIKNFSNRERAHLDEAWRDLDLQKKEARALYQKAMRLLALAEKKLLEALQISESSIT